MAKELKLKKSADEIAAMASRGEDISGYFTNTFSVHRAPEGTVWFGGDVDRFRISLSVRGEGLDPDVITSILQCQPTSVRFNQTAKLMDGTVISTGSQWTVDLRSEECDGGICIEDGVQLLLAKLTGDFDAWAELTKAYTVRFSCGLFLEAENRGFVFSPAVSRMVAERNLTIGFDIYCSAPRPVTATSFH
ncbi:MAG: DUF4279 domain-containing protein [Bryobacteraceae bacterium]